MKRLIFIGIVLLGFGCKPSLYLQKNEVKLSAPKLYVTDVFFDHQTIVTVGPTARGAGFVYTTNNGNRSRFKKQIVVKETSKISVSASGGGYETSDMSELEVVKVPGLKNNAISSGRALDTKYGKEGLDILIDVQKGGSDFRNGWLGYSGGSVKFKIEFDERTVDYVIVSTLRNQGAWIFSPIQINIYADNQLVATHDLPDEVSRLDNNSLFSKIRFPKVSTNHLEIELIAPKEIPEWHAGKGEQPWMFIDEILIY